jgi:hypothetical protein
MIFQQVKAIDGSIDANYIRYQDDAGSIWIVPQGHRFWVIYQDWLAAGHTPQPAA